MSSTQYIEIVSQARDRDMYPNPADFVIPFNGEIKSDIKSAINPISHSYPEFKFTGSDRSVIGSFGNVDGPGTPGEPYLNDRAKTDSSYYNGQILELLPLRGTFTTIYNGTGPKENVQLTFNGTTNHIISTDPSAANLNFILSLLLPEFL